MPAKAVPNHTPANGTAKLADGTQRLKRTSSLMKQASTLPKVEQSLEEFIARANQTLVDVSTWGTADQQAKEEEDKRRELDAQRWKQAEQQMRESEAREQSLRRQLDGLQGKLAEAEAKVAVALSASGSFPAMNKAANAANEAAITELRNQIEQAMQRMRAAEQRSAELARELDQAKAATTTARSEGSAPLVLSLVADEEVDERVKLAEAKAAKAIAAARAAAAGLTVSAADLAAIESGLVVPMQPEKKSPWLAITLAFVGGLAIMAVVWKFVLSSNDKPGATTSPAPATQPAQAAQPAPAPTTTTPSTANAAAPTEAKPSVTPIEDKTADKAADSKPSVTPIDEPPAAQDAAKDAAKPDVASDEPVVDAKPAKAAKTTSRPKKAAVAPKSVKKEKKETLADPFAEPAPAPKKKDTKGDKAGGAIVDPFGG
ncbi:MAG TPA: hypothetical protein VFQ53_14525 [Kofleriaceae bacterium]|nr:hypothetical protein [Kofleriaceae bacterium]